MPSAKSHSIFISILVLCSFANGFSQKNVTLKYEGSSTIAHFIRDAEASYGKIKFEINTESESSGGELAVMHGSADLGGVAKVPNPAVLSKGIESTLIGWDAIVVLLHPSNPVNNLTREQLKAIFTSKITNWKEVGGPDLDINPYIVSRESATRNVFRSRILGAENYINCVTVVPDSEISKKVANDPGGIGQLSLSFLEENADIKKINIDGQAASTDNQSYPITRPLHLLWWPGRKATADFVEWTQTSEGQRILKKRFIGKSQEEVLEKGRLIVYTPTEVVEEGGTYFYPHESYKIYSEDGAFIQTVANHLDLTDETPAIITLDPGQYLVWSKTAQENGESKLLVNVKSGDVTKVVMDEEYKSIGRQTPSESTTKSQLNLYGDFRFRLEQDWNSRRFNGTFRDDRFRMRYRLRFGFTFNLTKSISMGARLRSGVAESLQSPHNNLGHRDFTGVPIALDKVFLGGKHNNFWWWVGKNNFPFWKQNELFWDDDVTPEGIAVGTAFKLKGLNIKPKAAYFVTSTGSGNFDPRDPTNGRIDGQMIGAQLELGFKVFENKVTLANSFFALRDINNVPSTDFFYNDERFKLDFTFLVSGLKIELNSKIPITLGLDHFVNLEDYNGAPDTLVNPIYKDQNMGFVLSANIGRLSKKGDWLFGYYYARKEEYSVVSYYTEDDWVRFGNINRNRNTNYQGHEFRVAYAFDSRFNIVARAYFVEGLVTPDVAKESGNRFRLDFNMKFNKQVQ